MSTTLQSFQSPEGGKAGASAGTQALFAAVARLLKPLVRILLNHGVAYDRFADLARAVFVDVAYRDFTLPGRKQTVSRVSVLTGLTRKEVVRLMESQHPHDAESAQSYNRAARVVTGWRQDYPLEGTASGAQPLPIEGEDSFSTVVKRYSGDMPMRAVLDELMRVGAVRRRGDEVELVYRHYIPPVGETRKLIYLGEDVADLISTIGHNLAAQPGATRFQRKVFYDNVPAESLDAIRALARAKGEQLMDELARDMAQHDRDVTPSRKGTGRMRTVVGIYYSEEAFTSEADTASPPDRPSARTPQPSGAREP